MFKRFSRPAIAFMIAAIVMSCNLPLPRHARPHRTADVGRNHCSTHPGGAKPRQHAIAERGNTERPQWQPTPPIRPPLHCRRPHFIRPIRQFPPYTPVPCNQAGFVSDVTIPDNTTMTPGQSFTKTWRIRNNGSCTWTTSYKVVFDSGDAMSGPASFALPGTVAPGQTIDISVNLTAPTTPNTTSKPNYKGNWKLKDQNGVIFGLGGGNSAFYVQIVVSSASFAVTNAEVSAEHSHIEAACPNPGEPSTSPPISSVPQPAQ